jgi:hypothetical protein
MYFFKDEDQLFKEKKYADTYLRKRAKKKREEMDEQIKANSKKYELFYKKSKIVFFFTKFLASFFLMFHV